MPKDHRPPSPVPPSHGAGRLPTRVMVNSGLLLLIPMVGLAIVPVYSRLTPRLWGFPFFYWYQFAWVFLASACTWGAYKVINRSRKSTR